MILITILAFVFAPLTFYSWNNSMGPKEAAAYEAKQKADSVSTKEIGEYHEP